MDTTETARLRRFALTAALLLITYVEAGIVVEPDARISVFGVPVHVGRPDLLPAGLALAALCGGLRFYYYGLMLATSPHRKRRELLNGLTAHFDEYIRPGKPIKPGAVVSGTKIPMYWGPQKFETASHYDEELVRKRAMAFDNVFPKFACKRASARVVGETFLDDEGETHQNYCVEVIVPLRCRAAAIFEDLDYTAPAWVSACAFLLFLRTLA
ncbi:MAG: hypothetical protein HYR72_19510 [Deltaproteobacteria bacterium]|nr:hypothetical protein [Deltaproteobacteria bacterium]MBI3387291.1 hypothetical protein [Deltaproteobacteria bacterium]